ncbi:MAG: hypothetical protein KDD46_03790 [Bdellovibrionales bacterium]|nr:hypothetical protein [Bdellovibrionales bacterium]
MHKKTFITLALFINVVSFTAYAQQQTQNAQIEQAIQNFQPTAEVKSNGFTLNPVTKTLIFDLKVSPYFNTDSVQKYDQLSDINIPKLTFTDLEGSAFQLITPNLLGGNANKSFEAYIRNLKKQKLYVGLEIGSVLRKPFLTMNQNYDTLSSYAPGAVTFYYSQKISDANVIGHGVQVYAEVKLMPIVSVEDEHGNVPHIMREDEVESELTDYCMSNPSCILVRESDQENQMQFASIEAGIRTSKMSIGFDLEYMNISPAEPSTALYNHDTGARTYVETRRAMETYKMTTNFDYTLWKDKDLGKLTVGAFAGADMTVGMSSIRTGSRAAETTQQNFGVVPGIPTMNVTSPSVPAESLELIETAYSQTGTQKVIAPFFGIKASYEFGSEGTTVRKKRNHYSNYKRGKKFNPDKAQRYRSGGKYNPITYVRKFFVELFR